MLSEKYRQAISEVLTILDNTEKKYVEMIPISFLDFLKKNASSSYKMVYDASKSFNDIPIKPETAGILSIIYMNYWCTPEEKIGFQKILNENQLKYDEMIQRTYNSNSPFIEKREEKLNNVIESNQMQLDNEKLPTSTKKSWFSLIINKIKALFVHKA